MLRAIVARPSYQASVVANLIDLREPLEFNIERRLCHRLFVVNTFNRELVSHVLAEEMPDKYVVVANRFLDLKGVADLPLTLGRTRLNNFVLDVVIQLCSAVPQAIDRLKYPSADLKNNSLATYCDWIRRLRKSFSYVSALSIA